LETRPSSPIRAGGNKKSRTDLALLKVAREDAIRATCQWPCEIGLAQSIAAISAVAIHGVHVEGAKLHLVIVLAGVQCVEVGVAVLRTEALAESGIGMDTRPKIAAIKYIRTVLAQTKGTEKTRACRANRLSFY
jgi:hypothetical protein